MADDAPMAVADPSSPAAGSSTAPISMEVAVLICILAVALVGVVVFGIAALVSRMIRRRRSFGHVALHVDPDGRIQDNRKPVLQPPTSIHSGNSDPTDDPTESMITPTHADPSYGRAPPNATRDEVDRTPEDVEDQVEAGRRQSNFLEIIETLPLIDESDEGELDATEEAEEKSDEVHRDNEEDEEDEDDEEEIETSFNTAVSSSIPPGSEESGSLHWDHQADVGTALPDVEMWWDQEHPTFYAHAVDDWEETAHLRDMGRLALLPNEVWTESQVLEMLDDEDSKLWNKLNNVDEDEDSEKSIYNSMDIHLDDLGSTDTFMTACTQPDAHRLSWVSQESLMSWRSEQGGRLKPQLSPQLQFRSGVQSEPNLTGNPVQSPKLNFHRTKLPECITESPSDTLTRKQNGVVVNGRSSLEELDTPTVHTYDNNSSQVEPCEV